MRTAAILALALASACSKDLVCPRGETDCGGRCVSLLSAQGNCGACGHACGPLEVCSGGTCGCAPGIETCAGACTDLARDAANCGACGAACAAGDLCATVGGGTGCVSTCPAGFAACGRSCVDLASDPFDCGACGNACPAGQACRDGACRSDLEVACYATDEVVPVTAELSPAGDPRSTPAGPIALAIMGAAAYSANGYPSASVSVLPLDPALPSRDVPVSGNDLEGIAAYENVLLVTNASTGTLLVLDAGGDVLDAIPLPDQQLAPNPHGVAAAGGLAWVALSGIGAASGQSIAKVDLSSLATCAAVPPEVGGPARTPCGSVVAEIALTGVPGASDAPGLPFPSDVAEVGGRIYVTLANLEEDTISCGASCSYTAYVKPAGDGKLAVIDPAAGDALSIVDLGAGCGNPGALAVAGTTLWVACGSFSYPELAPSVLVPVDLGQTPPAPGTPLPVPGIVPGKVAICSGAGYVTDQASGAVVRFDPLSREVQAPTPVCPTSALGWAWASDVACAE